MTSVWWPTPGLMLPATLAQHLGLRELFDEHVDLGDAAGPRQRRAQGDDAHPLGPGRRRLASTTPTCCARVPPRRCSATGCWPRRRSARSCAASAGAMPASSTGCRASCWSGPGRPGPVPATQPVTIDVDSSIRETYGLAKQGGVFSHTKVRGYHPLWPRWPAPARWCTPACAAATPTRAGERPASSPRPSTGCARRVPRDRSTLRADSGFYNHKVVDACRAAEVRFSITAKLYPGLKQVIDAIDESPGRPSRTSSSGADVAETTYQPFGTKGQPCRLIVRRVRPTPGTQLALFTEFSYHAFITDRDGDHARARSRPPPSRRDRERHPRPQIRRRPQPPALGALRRQRRLARPQRHRPQPGPL